MMAIRPYRFSTTVRCVFVLGALLVAACGSTPEPEAAGTVEPAEPARVAFGTVLDVRPAPLLGRQAGASAGAFEYTIEDSSGAIFKLVQDGDAAIPLATRVRILYTDRVRIVPDEGERDD